MGHYPFAAPILIGRRNPCQLLSRRILFYLLNLCPIFKPTVLRFAVSGVLSIRPISEIGQIFGLFLAVFSRLKWLLAVDCSTGSGGYTVCCRSFWRSFWNQRRQISRRHMADMWAICAPCFPGVWLTAGLVVPNGPMDRPYVAKQERRGCAKKQVGHTGPIHRPVVALMSVLAGPASLVITTVAHMGAIHRPYVLRVGRSEQRLSL